MAFDVTIEKPISGGLINMEAFWRQAFSKKLRKTTREVVSTSKVWSSTSKETGNRQEVRSSPVPVWEKLWEDSWDCRRQQVVGAYRDQPQLWWTVTVRHTLCVSSIWDWVVEIEALFDYATPRWRLELFFEERRKLRSRESFAACIRSIAKLAISNINVYRASQ